MKRYSIQKANKFFGVNDALVRREIRYGDSVSFSSEVDLGKIEEMRKGAGEHKPCYTAFVVKAVALALREFPYANRRICKRSIFGRIWLQQFKHADIAVACERNVPGVEAATFMDVIRDADSKTLTDTNRWLRKLAVCDVDNNRQWRDYLGLINRFPAWLAALLAHAPVSIPSFWSKYRGGSVLVSSPAKYGVDLVTASWPAPLGVSFGLVKNRPCVRNNEIVIRPTFWFLLNWDRRVMAGAQAARFFKRIVDILESADMEMKDVVQSSAGMVSNKVTQPVTILA